MKKRIVKIIMIAVAIALTVSTVTGIRYYRSVNFNPALLLTDSSAGRGTVFTDRYDRELRFLPDQKGERARWIPLSEVPDMVKKAFIAAEDKRFYQHHGFDGIAIMRAAWRNLTKRKIITGASTISQQVVRLVYSSGGESNFPLKMTELTEKNRKGRNYRNKIEEIIRSVNMEEMCSKDAILEQYLNRVPLGNNLVGIETAAQAYFGTSVKTLSASETALLASLPKAPGLLNPYGSNYLRLVERRNWVLARMDALGFISHEKYLLAKDEKPRLRKLAFASAAPHVVDMLLKQGMVGGRIKTTIDLDLQTRVQEILAAHAERLKGHGADQAAAIVIHNPTMEVLASVGSIEYSEKNNGFNDGVLLRHSAGSTLKPFLYTLAMESGETVTTLLADTERKYWSREGQYSPFNFDRKEYGPVTMRTALGSSLNIAAVKMLERVGEENFYDMLTRMNMIAHPERGPERYGLGMAIGNLEVSPVRLAVAYAMLANGGIYRQEKYLLKNTDHPGTSAKKRYIFLPQTAYIVTDILSDPTARLLTFNPNGIMMRFPFRLAIKTGTSTFFRDLWTVGYTPDYTVAVWVGNFDGSPTKNLSGSSAATPLFFDIMTWLYRQSEPISFKQPKGIRRVMVCGYSGMKPAEYCTHTIEEVYVAGTVPQETCTFHTAGTQRHELAAPYAQWLYKKNRLGSAGKFRLSGFGDDLDTVFHDPWEGVPTEQREPGVRSRTFVNERPVTVSPIQEEQQEDSHYSIGGAPDESASPADSFGDGEIKIIYPLEHDRFVLNRDNRNQVIKLQAVVARSVSHVDWFVNGKLYKRTGPPYQTYWPIVEGRFRVTAVTPSNVADSVQVTVE